MLSASSEATGRLADCPMVLWMVKGQRGEISVLAQFRRTSFFKVPGSLDGWILLLSPTALVFVIHYEKIFCTVKQIIT